MSAARFMCLLMGHVAKSTDSTGPECGQETQEAGGQGRELKKERPNFFTTDKGMEDKNEQLVKGRM